MKEGVREERDRERNEGRKQRKYKTEGEKRRVLLQIIYTVLCLHWQTEGRLTYHIGVSKQMTSVPGTLRSMMNAFNDLNNAIRPLLAYAEDVAEEVRIILCGWLTSV